jgi:hypothetical protein
LDDKKILSKADANDRDQSWLELDQCRLKNQHSNYSCFRQLLYSTKVKSSLAFDFLELLQSLHYMQLELAENKDAIYSERNKLEPGLIKNTSLFL